jgi:hypothetical protein
MLLPKNNCLGTKIMAILSGIVSQIGMIFIPREHLAMSGDIFGDIEV